MSKIPYESAIAVGDLMDAFRENDNALRRANVSFHHFRLQLEGLPDLDDEMTAEQSNAER